MTKPEPIMLLLFFPEFSIIFTHYSLFIPMPLPIIPYYSSNFIMLMAMMSIVHMVADKWMHFSMIKIENFLRNCIVTFMLILTSSA